MREIFPFTVPMLYGGELVAEIDCQAVIHWTTDFDGYVSWDVTRADIEYLTPGKGVAWKSLGPCNPYWEALIAYLSSEDGHRVLMAKIHDVETETAYAEAV